MNGKSYYTTTFLHAQIFQASKYMLQVKIKFRLKILNLARLMVSFLCLIHVAVSYE